MMIHGWFLYDPVRNVWLGDDRKWTSDYYEAEEFETFADAREVADDFISRSSVVLIFAKAS
jgi:hypothetical protein